MNILQRIFGKTTDHIELGTKNRSYWWRIVADNGNVLCHSENYRRKASRDEVMRAFSERNGIPIWQSVLSNIDMGELQRHAKAQKRKR